MRSKRERVKSGDVKNPKKYQLPDLSWNEWVMIMVFLSIMWFAWGQFQI